jgi:asparagine synthase (glutamine-hydrolysing)
MRQEVTVGLTGSGGDELFGNYGKYRLMEARGLQRSRQIYRNALRWHGGRSSQFGNQLQAWAEALDAQRPETFDQPLALYSHLYYTDGEKRRFILAPQMLLDSTSTRDWMMRAGAALRTVNAAPRDQVMYLDFKTQLPEEFLFMTDRFSMAHSLEARVPFLDQPFIDLVSQIPAHIRTRSDDPKYLLRRAVGDLLPAEVIGSQKRGFVLPTGAWLRGPLRGLVEHLLSPDYLKTQGIFQPGYYPQFVLPHLDGKVDRGEHIWAVLMFQLWHTVYIQENATAKPSFRWQDLC